MRVLERNTKNPARCSTESESLPVKPFTRKISVLPVVVLHHQYSKNQPLSVGFFSPIPASTGGDSGHGLASVNPPNLAFSPRPTYLCSPFSLVVSRACARPLSVLAGVWGRSVVVGNSCCNSDRKQNRPARKLKILSEPCRAAREASLQDDGVPLWH